MTKFKITYKRVATGGPNVSSQHVSHEIYVDGKFRGRHTDPLTAKELVDELVAEGGVFVDAHEQAIKDWYKKREQYYDSFKGVSKEGLKSLVSRSYRVIDTNGLGKADLKTLLVDAHLGTKEPRNTPTF